MCTVPAAVQVDSQNNVTVGNGGIGLFTATASKLQFDMMTTQDGWTCALLCIQTLACRACCPDTVCDVQSYHGCCQLLTLHLRMCAPRYLDVPHLSFDYSARLGVGFLQLPFGLRLLVLCQRG